MRRIPFTPFIFVCLLCIPLACAAQPDDPVELMAILKAVHADFCAAVPSDHRLVITDRPYQPVFTEEALKKATSADPPWVPRAEAKTLWPRGEVCAGLRVVDHRILEKLVIERDALPRDTTAFSRRFDGARSYEAISLPAYSPDGTRISVYVEHLCPLCGSGTRYELTRAPDGWKVIRTDASWVS